MTSASFLCKHLTVVAKQPCVWLFLGPGWESTLDCVFRWTSHCWGEGTVKFIYIPRVFIGIHGNRVYKSIQRPVNSPSWFPLNAPQVKTVRLDSVWSKAFTLKSK